MRFIRICIASIGLLSLSMSAYAEEKETLVNGWYPWDPYQYIQRDPSAGEALTGLDIELTRSIARIADYDVVYQPVEWKQHQDDLKDGKRDFASGATYTPERAQYAYFSKPYRYEEDSLFVRRGEESNFQFQNIQELLHIISNGRHKVAIIDGFQYADPTLNAWIADPKNSDLIVRVPDERKSVRLLVNNSIDAFLSDRISGATQIWRLNKGSQVNEVSLGIRTPIHFMFSKASVPISVVERFDRAIDQMKNTSNYQELISGYLHPALLLQTLDSPWFRIIEIIGTIAFAISGLVIAVRDRSTLFGAFLFAMLPAIGGGMMRDVIVERRPIGALQAPEFLFIVVATVLLGFIGIRLFNFLNRYFNLGLMKTHGSKAAHHILMLCDGLGLAAFTVTAVVVSVIAKANPLWLWGPFLAFLTGAGGGLIRDALSKQRDFVSLGGDIYPEIAILWGAFLSLFLMTQIQAVNPELIRMMVFLTVVGAFLTRVIVYYFGVPNVYFSAREKKLTK